MSQATIDLAPTPAAESGDQAIAKSCPGHVTQQMATAIALVTATAGSFASFLVRLVQRDGDYLLTPRAVF